MKSTCVLACLLVVMSALTDATFVIASGTTVTAATAYSAAALAGVVGLALGAGVVGVGALKGRRQSRRRGRRDTSLELRQDMLLDVVAASDSYGCALKLVCALEARNDEQLHADDRLILNLFGRRPEVVADNSEVASSRHAFSYAASLGASQGVEACRQVFHTCDYSYDQMMSYVRALRG